MQWKSLFLCSKSGKFGVIRSGIVDIVKGYLLGVVGTCLVVGFHRERSFGTYSIMAWEVIVERASSSYQVQIRQAIARFDRNGTYNKRVKC